MNIRAAVVTATTIASASIAAAVIMASPTHEASPLADFPGTAPVVTPSPAQPKPYKPMPRATATHPDRSGVRHSAIAAPKATPSTKHTGTAPADIRISYYQTCNASPQRCIDAGSLTAYNTGATPILAGHNYRGYQWLSRVPAGKRVIVVSGPLAGTYRVYGHLRLGRQGGSIPSFGGASLVLQSCEGNGTGFSLLRRI
ncbi:hypothetical protein [Streptomyces sp. NPDC055006]